MNISQKSVLAFVTFMPLLLNAAGEAFLEGRIRTAIAERQSRINSPISGERVAQRAIEQRLRSPEECIREAVELRETIRFAHEIAHDPANNPQALIASVNAEQAEYERREREELEASIKWRNTLLTPFEINGYTVPVGFYKRDLIELPIYGVQLYARKLLRTSLKQRREETIIKHITEGAYNSLIEILESVKKAEEKYELEYEEKSALGKLFTVDSRARDVLLNPIREYLYENHYLIGYLPINTMVLFPLLSCWLFDKTSSWLESTLLEKDYDEIFRRGGVQALNMEYLEAFQPNAEGQLIKAEKTPFTLTTSLRFCEWLLSFSYFHKLPSTMNLRVFLLWLWGIPAPLFNDAKIFKTMSQLAGVKLPDAFYSKPVELAIEYLGYGFSAKLFDRQCGETWTKYVLENREKFLTRLKNYKRAVEQLDNAEVAVKEAERKLRKFVENGHRMNSWLPGAEARQWWKSESRGSTTITNAVSLGLTGIMAYKLARWYWNITHPRAEHPA